MTSGTGAATATESLSASLGKKETTMRKNSKCSCIARSNGLARLPKVTSRTKI
jgi:hypothetical protein